MAGPSTSQALLEMVRKSGVISPERVDAYLQEHASLPDDLRQVAAQLVRDGIVTTFQAKQMLRGRWKGFFFGFGKFRVLEQLGEGGTAGVYLCADLRLRRRVAVKILPESKTK